MNTEFLDEPFLVLSSIVPMLPLITISFIKNFSKLKSFENKLDIGLSLIEYWLIGPSSNSFTEIKPSLITMISSD